MPLFTFIFLLIIGFILAKNPKKLWKLECAMGFKYGEATETYLKLTRICGIVIIFAAFYITFLR